MASLSIICEQTDSNSLISNELQEIILEYLPNDQASVVTG